MNDNNIVVMMSLQKKTSHQNTVHAEEVRRKFKSLPLHERSHFEDSANGIIPTIPLSGKMQSHRSSKKFTGQQLLGKVRDDRAKLFHIHCIISARNGVIETNRESWGNGFVNFVSPSVDKMVRAKVTLGFKVMLGS